MQPARQRMRLELRGDGDEQHVVGVDDAIDVLVEHGDEAAATLLEAPLAAKRRIVEHRARMQLGGDRLRCADAEQENEVAAALPELAAKAGRLHVVVASVAAEAMVEADHLHAMRRASGVMRRRIS